MQLFLLFINAFLLSILISPIIIRGLKNLQFGQSIREDGPQSHKKKGGTPTLGGIIFLFSLTLVTLTYLGPSTEILLLLLLTLGNGAIGFLDDFIKISLKRNLGLTSKQKMIAQIIVSSVFLFILAKQGLDTTLSIPGTNVSVELSWAYFLFAIFLIVGTTNATNLTDGLDGLLTGTSIIALGCLGVISFGLGNQEVGMYAIIFVGALAGFLLFNKNPAKIFMGDTGSLAIGGALVGIAIILKVELLLAIVGGVFVIETLSVIVQVLSFKFRKKRIFKMSPIHHHYELSGFSEVQVVKGFWLAGAALGILAVWIV